MKKVDSKPMPPAPPRTLSRRRLLGGALTAALAAALPLRDVTPKPRPDRWHGKTRWIGHA
jgi:hypothetical protein